ncbi:hypothetical protein AMECASPLE_008439, partial [Ameca splendens]
SLNRIQSVAGHSSFSTGQVKDVFGVAFADSCSKLKAILCEGEEDSLESFGEHYILDPDKHAQHHTCGPFTDGYTLWGATQGAQQSAETRLELRKNE